MGQGGEQGQQSEKRWKKYEKKEDFILFSKHQLYKCIYSWL